MEWLKRVADKQSVRISAFVLMALVLLSGMFLMSRTVEEPEDEPSAPTSTVTRPSDSFTDGSADSDATSAPADGAEPEESAEPVEPVLQPTTDLTLEAQEQALQTAEDGFLAWYDLKPSKNESDAALLIETDEERLARVGGFFTADSPHRTAGPEGATGADEVYMRATFNWMEAISADSEEVRVLLAARTSGQMATQLLGGAPGEQMVVSTDETFLIVMHPEDGVWKISSIVEQ